MFDAGRILVNRIRMNPGIGKLVKPIGDAEIVTFLLSLMHLRRCRWEMWGGETGVFCQWQLFRDAKLNCHTMINTL
jgi:hypothetical protein